MSTLKRSRRRELVLTPSFAQVVKSKIGGISSQLLRRPSKSSLKDSQSAISRVSRRCLTTRQITIHEWVHPIHFLPPEILAHVFKLGADGQDDASLVFPILLSHVCGAWRDLALKTPSLWSNISPDSRWYLWKYYLHRSSGSPVDISLPTSHSPDAATVHWQMHLVAPYIRRWRSFTAKFRGYAPFLWNAVLSSCCGSSSTVEARYLEELTLVYPKNDDTKEFTLFGGTAPRLRRLTIAGLRLDWLPSLFGNLTYLDYTHHSFTRGHDATYEVLSLLQVSNRLQELRITFPVPCRRYEYLYDLPVMKLPSLVRLHMYVRHDVPSEIITLLGSLHFPSLHSLHLHDVSRSSHPFPSLKYVSRAFRVPITLKVLDLEDGWWDKRFVAGFAGITTLVVNGIERWRQF